MLTTPEVAERLGVTTRRVLALIQSGRLPSRQFGRDHLIKESDLALVKNRPMGRPKSSPATQKHATGAARASNGTSTKKKGGKK
jgi:excisionase family DNA binding protein